MDSPWFRKTLVVLVLIAAALYFVLVREPEPSEGLTWVDLSEQRAQAERAEQQAVAVETPLEPEMLALGPKPEVPKVKLRVTGRVVDASGAPVPRLAIERRHAYLDAAQALSDEEGRFVIEVDELHGELLPLDSAWMLLGGARHLNEDQAGDYQIVVAPAVMVRGSVVDPSGDPIPDAALFAFPPSDALVPFGIVAPPVEHESQRGWSGADGSFRIGPLPHVPGARVEASLTGYEPASALLPEDPSQPVVIVLSAR